MVFFLIKIAFNSYLLNIPLIQVTLEGIPKNPGEKDDYYKTKGPIPKFSSEYACIQKVVSFSTNDSALGKNMIL